MINEKKKKQSIFKLFILVKINMETDFWIIFGNIENELIKRDWLYCFPYLCIQLNKKRILIRAFKNVLEYS